MRGTVEAELERFTGGDIQAFETLFREYQGEVYGWIVGIVRDPGAAEDLTVETFWRIYRARARFDPRRPFGAWARRIASNLALEQGRIVPLGSIQKVMRESIEAAAQYIKANHAALGITAEWRENYDVAVLATFMGVPKEGPSAGITIVTGIVSALTNRPMRNDVAIVRRDHDHGEGPAGWRHSR